MKCAYCGKIKEYPKDFPVSHYAQCSDCYNKEQQPNWLNILKNYITKAKKKIK
jgi:hypothetical protein